MSQTERRLRAEREMLLARYDSQKFPPAYALVVKLIEIDIAWLEHGRAA